MDYEPASFCGLCPISSCKSKFDKLAFHCTALSKLNVVEIFPSQTGSTLQFAKTDCPFGDGLLIWIAKPKPTVKSSSIN